MKLYKHRILYFLILFFSLFCIHFSTSAQIQVGQDIVGQNAQDEAGRAVCMPDSNTLAIGAPYNNGNGSNAGQVRIFTLVGSNWIQKGNPIIGEAAEDASGFKLNMPNPNTIAITSFLNDGNGTNAGHVRVFYWNGNAWVQKGNDIDGEATNTDNFGASVDMYDENNLVVGDLGNSVNGVASGRVWIYTWNGNAWVQKGNEINGENTYDRSGWSVSMPDSNFVAIGAPFNSAAGLQGGHARVYKWNGNAWVKKGNSIIASSSEDWAGVSAVMPDTNTLALGAPLNESNGIESGQVSVFKWNGNAWIPKGNPILGENTGDQAGWSIDMPDSNTIAIVAPLNAGNGLSTGHARVYFWDGLDWKQLGFDINLDNAYEQSVSSISMPNASTVAVGSSGNNPNSVNAGIVKVYKFKGVQGLVFNDLNQNCLNDETGIVEGIKGYIQPGNIIVETTSSGYWIVDSLPIGNYTISYDTSTNWQATCPGVVNFSVTNPSSFTIAPSFGMINNLPCEAPNVSIHMPFMRPGFSEQKVYVSACNSITASGSIEDAFVIIPFDFLLNIDSTSIPSINLGGNIYRFDLDTITPGECVNFYINTTLNASAILGQTLCVNALLYPIDSCVLDSFRAETPLDFTPCSLPWDRSSLEIMATCIDDSIVVTITNNGVPGDGDMDCFSPFRLYVDGDYIWLDSVKLEGGESVVYIFQGDGRTWRFEVDQHPLHPGNSNPSATIERCGDPLNWTPDLINIFPLDDLDPIIDIYCGVVSGSYDPNDKTGYPLGIGEDHLIAPNTKMEYVIRFQNTGTDTAFNIVVRDTLESDFNIFSVKSGVASHAYSFKMFGPRVLEWTFKNILLPDSTTNEPESHGFVTFSVDQVKDLPDGTALTNRVGIYFDFNLPIITNTTSHYIGKYIETAIINTEFENSVSYTIYPNPSSGNLHISFNEMQKKVNLLMYSIDGKLMKSIEAFNQQDISLYIENEPGIYFLKIISNDEESTVKILKK